MGTCLQACARLQEDDWAQLGFPKLLKAAGRAAGRQEAMCLSLSLPALTLPV